jgi:hypothetical protein
MLFCCDLDLIQRGVIGRHGCLSDWEQLLFLSAIVVIGIWYLPVGVRARNPRGLRMVAPIISRFIFAKLIAGPSRGTPDASVYKHSEETSKG